MKMATAILQSQDRLRHQTLTLTPPASLGGGSSRSRRRKRSPVKATAKLPSQNLVMGQVKILKRGEACNFGCAVAESNLNQKGLRSSPNPNPKTKARVGGLRKAHEVDLGLCSTDRIGPEPDLVQRQVKVSVDGVYAGSAIFASPPPSSLPLPGFLEKHGAATNDLRRILRLSMV